MDCIFTEAHLYRADGKVDIVKTHSLFEEDRETHTYVLHMMRLCLYPTGANACEVAYNLHLCWKKADPKARISYLIEFIKKLIIFLF